MNIENEFKERGVNINWFGAQAGGEINASPAIQAALSFIEEKRNENEEYYLFIPSGKYRIVDPIKIKIPRLNIMMQGTSTMLLADRGVPALFSLEVPRPKSSSLRISGGMLIGADVLIKSEEASVDLIVNNVWFGSSKYHIKGSFVTLNLTSSILELASEGSICTENVDGFRKVNISGCNFFGNGGHHINLIGDKLYNRVSVINISGNTFDQANMEIVGEKTKPFIRLAFVRDCSIKSNVMNGEHCEPNGFVTLLNCQSIELDNIYTYCRGTAVVIINSQRITSKGVVNNCENGVIVSNCNIIEIDNLLSNLSGYGVRVERSEQIRVSSNISNVGGTGIDVYGAKNMIIQGLVMKCNELKEATGSGIALRYSGVPTESTMILNSLITENEKYNIRIETGCEKNIVQTNCFGSDDVGSTFMDVGTGTISKDNYSFGILA